MSATSPETVQQRPRLLIVEDERIVAMSLRKQLQNLGYEVLGVVSSGEDAILCAAEMQPDLVLMDIYLEGAMDGVEAAGVLRSRYRLPVVYLTAYSNKDILERAKITEPFGYVLKPYEERELHVVLETALYRHRMENRLRERERWFAATLTSIGDGVVATDPTGRVTFMNPVAESLAGWAEAEAVGRPFEEVLPLMQRVSRQPLQTGLQKALKERTSTEGGNDAVLVARDRTEKYVAVCASPILDEGDIYLGGVLVLRDTTLELHYHQAHRMEAVGRLAGGIAHDFNNLLTVITGYCTILHTALAENPSAQAMVQSIAQAGSRAADLTRRLLAYSGRQILAPRDLDLDELLKNAEPLLHRTAGNHITIELCPGAASCRVRVDPRQLELALESLAIHARDTMPRGGRLHVATSAVEITAGELPEVRPGSYALITVSDNGPGMSPVELERVFDPFHVGGSQGVGSGLGLSPVYGILKQSGGHVRVDSKPGQGSTFRLYLPRATEDALKSPSKVGSGTISGSTASVLLVEDESSVRALMRFVLQQAGYQVLEAADGIEALDVNAGHRGVIDLLITDVVMPNMGGPQLAETLEQAYPDMRILFISGYNEDAELQARIHAGKSDFLQKPFSISVFTEKVRALLTKSR